MAREQKCPFFTDGGYSPPPGVSPTIYLAALASMFCFCEFMKYSSSPVLYVSYFDSARYSAARPGRGTCIDKSRIRKSDMYDSLPDRLVFRLPLVGPIPSVSARPLLRLPLSQSFSRCALFHCLSDIEPYLQSLGHRSHGEFCALLFLGEANDSIAADRPSGCCGVVIHIYA